MQNKEIRLASRPQGMPTEENFEFTESELSELADGELLVRTRYISVDPYLRGRMREGRSYIAPFTVGQVIESGVVGEVIKSRSPLFELGDLVMGQFGWRLYNVAKAEAVQKINTGTAPASYALGILGMPGLTAYFGLLDIGQPRANETVVVSGAAGAVGTVVCQIAKIKGCRVVAIAGGQEKCNYLRETLGVDQAIDYKTANGRKSAEVLRKELAEACPQGIDVYFDNVGGEISDAVITKIIHGARIVICGQISLYNLEQMDVGPRPQPFLLVNSALMRGFIITDYYTRFAEGVGDLGKWLAEGKLKYVESIVEGFENTPQAFIGLFTGENLGKQIVKID